MIAYQSRIAAATAPGVHRGAATEANLSEMPCWIQTPDDRDVLLHQIVENWQRSDMHPYDLADALARLRDSNGYSQAELATATGKSKGEISKLLALLDLDADVQKIAREDQTGHVTKRHSTPCARFPPRIRSRWSRRSSATA